MEKVLQNVSRKFLILKNINQKWYNFSDKSAFVKSIKYFGNTCQKLYFLTMFFLMNIFQEFDSFQKRILKPRIRNILA